MTRADLRGARRAPWSSSLGGRLALLTAVAVTLAVAAVSLAAWTATGRTLRAQVDGALVAVELPPQGEGSLPGPPVPGSPEQLCETIALTQPLSPVLGAVQLVRADGTTCTSPGGLQVVPADSDVALAAGGGEPTLRDDRAGDGTHVRVRTTALGDGYALLVVRDLTEVDATLARLAVVLAVLTAVGAGGSVLVGHLVARSGLRPVDRLTGAVEEVARTQDLSVPLEVRGDDEVARLSAAVNHLTEALDTSRQRQQQLVVDAGHELRTPLTSLRTNLELLARSERSGRPLPAADRAALLGSLDAQVVELSGLVDGLMELADDRGTATVVPVGLHEVVGRAVSRVARRGPQRVEVQVSPWWLEGDPELLERAVVNLLDNAVKFSPPDRPVEVRLDAGVLTVSDRGPGLDGEEAARAFDRFWRSPGARGLPGSGLGLAIVRDVVARHAGEASLAPRPGGGTVARVRLPGAPAAPGPGPSDT